VQSEGPGSALEPEGPETVTLAEVDGASTLTVRDHARSRNGIQCIPTGFFAEVLRSIITPAEKSSQFTVRTANRQGSDLIQSTIINVSWTLI
jgi:hypothetical protein